MLRPLLATLALTTALAAADYARADYDWGWVPVGGGGNLMTLHYHPTTPGLIALRSDVGGVFLRSPEAPTAWRSLVQSRSLGLADSSMRNPSGFAFDPGDDRVFWVTCENGVYRSADRGATWTRVHDADLRLTHDARKHLEPIAVDPTDPDVVYIGTHHQGLQRSTDGGASWEPIGSVPFATELDRKEYGVSVVLVDPRGGAVDGRSRVVYAGSLDHGIFRSEDGGASFERISDEHTTPHHLRLDPAGGIYLSTGEGLYRYHEGAWSADLLPDTTGFDVDRAQPERLVAVAQGKVQRSTDRGATWTALEPALGDTHGWWRDWKNPWGGPNTVSLDPHHPGRVIWLTCYMCYHHDDIWSDATTITWDNWYQGIEETVSFEIMTPPGSDYVYTGFGDIMGLRHDDLSAYPDQDDHTPGHVVPGYDYNPRDVDDIWHVRVGGWKWQGVQVYRSRDAGDSWTEVAKPFGHRRGGAMAAIAVSATDPGNVVVCSASKEDGNVFTTDGGLTWQRCRNLPANPMGHNPKEYWYFGNVLASDKVDGAFYVYDYRTGDGRTGRVWRSATGEHWEVVADDLPSAGSRRKLVSITAAHDRAGWLIVSADFAETALLSRDHGASWTPIAGFERIANADFGHAAPGAAVPTLWVNGQLAGGPYGIWRSDDYLAGVEQPTWVFCSDPDFPLLEPREVRGCKQEFGRVFVSEGGRGWIYATLRE